MTWNLSTGMVHPLIPVRPATQAPPSSQGGLLQRKCACGATPGLDGQCSECRETRLQREGRGSAGRPSVPSIVHGVLASPGQALDSSTRTRMEAAFGYDFGTVRVHTDSQAAESARAVHADAYAVGRELVFGANLYAPDTAAGQQLLAHELTHVIQQRGTGPADQLRIDSSLSSREREAQQLSVAVISGAPRVPVTGVDPGVLQRQESGRTGTWVSGSVADLPASRYVDRYTNVVYDVDYRHEGGNLSKWLVVNYADGTSIDVALDDIVEESMQPEVALQVMANGHVGDGGRIFPAKMNPATTPRLYAAKREAIAIMEEYNARFMLATLPAVMFILTMGIGSVGGPGPGRVTRTPVSRVPLRRGAPPTVTGEPPVQTGSTGGGRSTTPVPTTGTPGNRAASVRAAEERATQRAATSSLNAAQQAMRDALVREHPGLNPTVAADAVRGAERVMGAGGRGADVVLLNGGGREVSVHSGAFTPQAIAGHLLDEAAQANTSEIYLQINTGTREAFLNMLPGLRSGYAELQNIFVKVFGPDGQVWWNGVFRGLR